MPLSCVCESHSSKYFSYVNINIFLFLIPQELSEVAALRRAMEKENNAILRQSWEVVSIWMFTYIMDEILSDFEDSVFLFSVLSFLVLCLLQNDL